MDVKRCHKCNEKREMSRAIGICVTCLRNLEIQERERFFKTHAETRLDFGLPTTIPAAKSRKSVRCSICGAGCDIGEGEWGWCGLRKNENGKMKHFSSKQEGLLQYYLDPHVTNCCNAWFCPAATGAGYPKHARHKGQEIGYFNLALFLFGCSFNCLFCQNWEHKVIQHGKRVSADELVALTLSNDRITCWCWFGGSPEPQLPFAINASRRALEEIPDTRVLRICFEWNGDGRWRLVEKAGMLAFESGGNVKFDFKAWTPSIHLALTGRDNNVVKQNIRRLHELFVARGDRGHQTLGVTTLLVPYYVDENEVELIARFLSELDELIPYSLLVFHPAFKMVDLPITPLKQVVCAFRRAKKYLKNVSVGNLHLLGYRSMSEFLRKAVNCLEE